MLCSSYFSSPIGHQRGSLQQFQSRHWGLVQLSFSLISHALEKYTFYYAKHRGNLTSPKMPWGRSAYNIVKYWKHQKMLRKVAMTGTIPFAVLDLFYVMFHSCHKMSCFSQSLWAFSVCFSYCLNIFFCSPECSFLKGETGHAENSV